MTILDCEGSPLRRKPWRAIHRQGLIQQGITLVEVVVGLALLGTLLAWIIIGAGELQKQQTLASERLRAVNEIDRLTSQFFRDGFPHLGASEPVSYSPRFYWQFTGTPWDVGSERLLIATVSIHSRGDSNRELNPSVPVATLQLLVHYDSIGKRAH